jgi:5'-phosphate synthase pdxT subunit
VASASRRSRSRSASPFAAGRHSTFARYILGPLARSRVAADLGAHGPVRRSIHCVKIGVLALQGAFREHLDTLAAIGVEGVRVREPADLEGVSGLILPGGESTTMRQLIDRWGLRQPILDLAESGAPIFGTCAGMIVLAREIAGGEEPILPLLDVTVERNAFGRQLDSFEADVPVDVLGGTPVHAVFIRAPIVERTGPDVDVLATIDDDRVVAVRQRNILATAFHPELAGETRFHRLMATMAAEHDDPGEGSGRRHHPTRRAQPR